MKLTKLFLLLASISALVIGSVSTALAAPTSASANLPVTATVVKSCSIATSAVAFGEYNPLLGAASTAEGSVSVTCSKGSGTSVALNFGANVGPGNQPRMTDGTRFLSYGLYSDSSHSTLWNGTSVAIIPATADVPTAQVLTVYGQLPGSQNVLPGAYLDTVQATVNF